MQAWVVEDMQVPRTPPAWHPALDQPIFARDAVGGGGVELDEDLGLDLLGGVGVYIVGVAGSFFAFFGSDGLLGFGCEFVNFFGGEVAALFENVLLLGGEGGGLYRLAAGEALGVAGLELFDFFADANRAPVVAAHGAEVGVDIEVFVVVGSGGVFIEGEFEVFVPVEGCAGFGEFVVPVAGAGDSECDIGSVGCDFVGDAAFFDIAFFG